MNWTWGILAIAGYGMLVWTALSSDPILTSARRGLLASFWFLFMLVALWRFLWGG